MPSGRSRSIGELPQEAAAVLHGSRRAVLCTMGPDGYPHAVPVCFAVVGGDVVTAIDQKPKSGRRLARLRNVEERGVATLLFDRWDEDWRRLGWVMIGGGARIEPPGTAVGELSARYAQYRDDPPAGESIVVSPHRIRWWTWR